MNYTESKSGKYVIRTFDNGSKSWWMNGKHHREDGPAIERSSGYKAWFLNGKRHREDGPAVEGANGSKAWFLNGKCVLSKYEDHLSEYPELSEEFMKSVILYKLRTM